MTERDHDLEQIMARANEIDVDYIKDRQKLSDEAFDLLMDREAGITTDRQFFLLAIHAITFYANHTSGEHEIITKYDQVSEFAHASVNAAMADIIENHVNFPRAAYIGEIMYVPHIQSPCNDRPKLRYRARQNGERGTRGGWIELGVMGRKVYGPDSSRSRGDLGGESYRALASVEAWDVNPGRVEDYTPNFTVGFQAIYEKRPNIVDIKRRKPEQIFTAIIDNALKEYPDYIR